MAGPMQPREALAIHHALHDPSCDFTIFRGEKYPIKLHLNNHCRSCVVFGAKFMTQNTQKNTTSPYAERAKRGERLTWIMGSEPWGLIANEKIELYPITIPNHNEISLTSNFGGLNVNSTSNVIKIPRNEKNSTANHSDNNNNNNNDNNNNYNSVEFNHSKNSNNAFKHSGNTIMGPNTPFKSSGKRDSPENTAGEQPNIHHGNPDNHNDNPASIKKIKLIDNFDIPFSELKLYPGNGSFGIVRKGSWRGLDVAVKILTNKKQKSIDLFRQEAELMCKLRHPNIVQILGVSKQEYLGQTLKEMINNFGGLERMPLTTFLHVAKGIALGINYLHKSEPPILHRDLKPANILLDSHFMPRVADFGVSRTKQKTSTMTKIGTPYYMAPEILLGKSYNEKVDVYSYAMILYQMVSGKVPFAKMGCNGEDLTPIQIGIENVRPEIPESCPLGVRHLICLAWDKDPAVRPSFSKIILLLESFEVDGGNCFPDDLIRLDEAECEKTLLQTVED